MTEQLSRARGRTRWRRFTLAFIPSMGVVGVVVVLMSTGAVALPVSIAGTVFTVKASSLTSHAVSSGPGFVQWGDIDTAGTRPYAVVVTDMPGGATLKNLDQIICSPPILVEITAKQAVANGGMVADVTDLTTDANVVSTFNNIQIGQPKKVRSGGLDSFGQTADSFKVAGNLNQKAVYTKAGTFALTGLSLHVKLVDTCPG